MEQSNFTIQGNGWATPKMKKPSESKCKGMKSLTLFTLVGKMKNNKKKKNRKENENLKYWDFITWSHLR